MAYLRRTTEERHAGEDVLDAPKEHFSRAGIEFELGYSVLRKVV